MYYKNERIDLVLNNKQKIGLALCGGGLQGFSHIGVIKALEELCIEPTYLSGTSTGSVIATLFSVGYTSDEICKICQENYERIMKLEKRVLLRMGINYMRYKDTKTEGMIDGKVISKFINKYTNNKGFKQISDIKNKKLAITTVDTITMKECIFSSCKIDEDDNIDYISEIEIGDAVRSSMAFPGIFTPVKYKDYILIDGGTVNNLPVDVLKKMGAEKTIAISFDLNQYTPSQNIEGILIRALDIFSLSSVKKGQDLADVNIKIFNPDTSLVKIKDLQETIEHGYNAVMNKKEEIIALLGED